MMTKVLLVGLEYSGQPYENVIIETKGLCRPEICKKYAANALYDYDIIIIYPKSYSHFIFGKETSYSSSDKELWELKSKDNEYDLDAVFDQKDRSSELDAALKQGTRVIFLLTPDKMIQFFGRRSLYMGYLNKTIRDWINSSDRHEKFSTKLSIQTGVKVFTPYFQQLQKDGWILCWNRDMDKVQLAITPENYSLGCEINIGNRKAWMLTPPSSREATDILIRASLDLTKEEVKVCRYHGIFLSHSHEDKEFVGRLRASLLQRGVENIWTDEAEILVGDSLIKKIQDGIEKTEYFGVILSPRSVKSPWVQHELEKAMNIEIVSKNVKVLPLLFEQCDLPGFLEGKLYADFTTSASYEESLEKLLRRLEISSQSSVA
jgi:hypothetical protein